MKNLMDLRIIDRYNHNKLFDLNWNSDNTHMHFGWQSFGEVESVLWNQILLDFRFSQSILYGELTSINHYGKIKKKLGKS